MPTAEWKFQGHNGSRFACRWEATNPERLAIISHGYAEHIGRYHRVAGELARTGTTVVGFDHVGHGRSAGERVLIDDLDDLAADLHRLVTDTRQRHPQLPTILVGHSLGGLVAARYTQLHPETLNRLVLSSPVLGSWRAIDLLLAKDSLPNKPLPHELLSRDPAVGQTYAADPLVWHGGFQRRTLHAIATGLKRFGTGPRIDRIPVLWLHGSDDRLVPIDGTRRGIERGFGANLTAHLFDGARHELLNESNRMEVMAVLREFLAAA